MNDTHASTEKQTSSEIYEIRLKGHLDARWAARFGDMTLTLAENGETHLIGPVSDQSALHGLLKTVRDVGLPLISISHVEPPL